MRGYDFNQGVDHQALLQSFYNTGFQATSFGLAVNQINTMVGRKVFAFHHSCCPPLKKTQKPTTSFLHFNRSRSAMELWVPTIKVWMGIHPLVPARITAPFSWVTPRTSSAAESERTSASSLSTKWCSFFHACSSSNSPAPSCVAFLPLVQVDVLVTTAGGIEEDLIKCLGPFYLGEFSLSGKDLYKKGLNR